MQPLNFIKFDPSVDDYHIIPEAPGNYLVVLKPGCKLPRCPVSYQVKQFNGLDVIYTGIAKLNLRKRDYRAHFKGTAGKSTLRKSLGCFWGYPYIPRDKNHPDNGHVMFPKEDEDALTQWMQDNLLLYFYPNNDCTSLELPLINEFNPPLNLMENHNLVNAEFRCWLSAKRSKKI